MTATSAVCAEGLDSKRAAYVAQSDASPKPHAVSKPPLANTVCLAVPRPPGRAVAVTPFAMPGHTKLGRQGAHRWSMFRTMVSQLINHERIETTVQKARCGVKPPFALRSRP